MCATRLVPRAGTQSSYYVAGLLKAAFYSASAAGTIDGKIVSHPQRALTQALELAAYDRLDLSYKAVEGY